MVNAQDGVWAITDMIIRSGYLPSVQRMMVPGYNHDERRRRMMLRAHNYDKQHRQIMLPDYNHDERYRQNRPHFQSKYFI